MILDPPLQQGVFVKRYKRFFADIDTGDGERLTLHCPNTGSMKNCLVAGSPCWYSRSDNPKRKLPGTLELVTTEKGYIAGVNTSRPNQLVEEAVLNGVIAPLQGYSRLRREVRYGLENSRIDLLLDSPEQPAAMPCYVEVKNVTLEADNGLANQTDGLLLFPDARTTRGVKHLRELSAMSAADNRAALVFCVQHSGVQAVAPADHIDPEYGAALRDAAAVGVEVLAYRCELSPEKLAIAEQLPVLL